MMESPSWLGAKNWACCPLSVTLYWRVTMRMDVKIVVLNCQKCNECLNCHKFPGLLFEAVFKIFLSLSMSLSLYLSFCWSGHVFLSHSRIALWRCPAPLCRHPIMSQGFKLSILVFFNTNHRTLSNGQPTRPRVLDRSARWPLYSNTHGIVFCWAPFSDIDIFPLFPVNSR